MTQLAYSPARAHLGLLPLAELGQLEGRQVHLEHLREIPDPAHLQEARSGAGEDGLQKMARQEHETSLETPSRSAFFAAQNDTATSRHTGSQICANNVKV